MTGECTQEKKNSAQEWKIIYDKNVKPNMINPRLTKGWLSVPPVLKLQIHRVKDLDNRKAWSYPFARGRKVGVVTTLPLKIHANLSLYLKSPFWKKRSCLHFAWSQNLLCILEMSFPSCVSQTPGEILIFRPFFFSIFLFFHVYWKSAILRFGFVLWRHCDVIHWMFIRILLCIKRGDP